ncbi:MAG TPA: amidohydrolase family protein [Gemmataceae bacterium]|jgi:predicted TIM-barrel fold metal-dependent hydrolase|nr:amidohydrolase family protein [Gemmataceae bacterium]
MTHDLPVTRRAALAAGTAALGAVLTRPAPAADGDLPWIDAHSHIWPAEVDKFPLAPGQTRKDLDPPSFTDDELMKIARPEGVGRVVLIQHSVYHLWDNSYLLDAVRRHPKTFRVQGMVDDHKPDPGAAMKRLLPLGVTGFRITPFVRTKAEQPKWLDTPGMAEMWKTGAKTRQAMCLLINPADLPATDAMCEKHPDTPVVIDHFARIGADGEIRDADVEALCRLARHKHAHVKISAYYALGKKKSPHDELVPMVRRLLDAFGPRRLMWASDAPYQVQGVNTYKASISLVRDRMDFLSKPDREWLLGKTGEAVFFYA